MDKMNDTTESVLSEVNLRDYFASRATEADLEPFIPRCAGDIADLYVRLGWIKPFRPHGDVITASCDKAAGLKLRAWARFKFADQMLAARKV